MTKNVKLKLVLKGPIVIVLGFLVLVYKRKLKKKKKFATGLQPGGEVFQN